ncbi:MAG TPA: aminoacyl-tRNA hydrolase [Gemmatimonadales bacterium]|nr:aminoacyl-tRNA hydrolase [Gemmatimonadales bacterium]
MASLLDTSVHAVTRYLSRLDSRIPVLREWPGTRRVVSGTYWRFVYLRQRSWQRLVFLRARRHRARLRNTLFVGVTGSTGKTTTTYLVAAVLSRCGPGKSTLQNLNRPHGIAQTVLSSRSADRFCVVEMSADAGPGSLDLPIRLVKPTIGVITNIGMDHFSLFRSLDATAAEKGKLITALPTAGTAILNVDDPRVAAMAGQCRGRVITYGLAPKAMVRAERVQSQWPDHLSFVAVHQGETVAVETRLHGVHWVSCVLAALATGLAVGLPLAEAARAVADVEPMTGRLSATAHPDGVTFLRDDAKAPFWSVAPALGVMRDARANRKVVVIGTLSDYPGASTRHYTRVARQALEVADLAVFVGPWASAGLAAKRHPADEGIKAFASVEDAAAFLHHELRAGDLVLLKGSNTADHLVRIMLARIRTVRCWVSDCGRYIFCETCTLLERPAGTVTSASRPSRGPLAPPEPPAVPSADPVSRGIAPGGVVPSGVVIVGLGNPGDRYDGTPHNVGHRVVDVLAARLGLTWTSDGAALVARGEWRGQPLCLVKPLVLMNHIGTALRELAPGLGLTPEACVLIHDDLDLPPGAVRARMSGSAGGHRGVTGIIEAFQSQAFPRVKIGVGRPPEGMPVQQFLLDPLPPADRLAIEDAFPAAVDRVIEVAARAASAR